MLSRALRRALKAALAVAETSGKPWPALTFVKGQTRRAVNHRTIRSLVELGYLTESDQGGVGFYSITNAGRKALAESPEPTTSSLYLSRPQFKAIKRAVAETECAASRGMIDALIDGEQVAVRAMLKHWPGLDNEPKTSRIRISLTAQQVLEALTPPTEERGPAPLVLGLDAMIARRESEARHES